MSRGGRIEVLEVAPPEDVAGLLPDADFIDAYSVSIGEATVDARAAAEAMTARQPKWIGASMAVRNSLVAPFGLTIDTSTAADKIGFFPVVSEAAHRIVLGFDDKHLDFRIIVDIREADHVHSVVATTLVSTHNLLGRVYLAVVLPFHRLIVRSMLRRIPSNLEAPRETARS